MTARGLPVVTDAALGALLHELVGRIEEAQLSELLTSGLDGETIDRLRAVRGADLLQVSRAVHSIFSVVVDTAQLKRALNLIERRQQEAQLLEYYVAHGATLAMIRTLLRPERGVAESYFETLECARQRGRPTLPRSAVRDRIHSAWAALGQTSSKLLERERLVELHKAFPEHSLATLYSVLNEFKQ